MFGILPVVYLLNPTIRPFKKCFDMLGLRGKEISRLFFVFRSISSKHVNHEFVEITNALVYFNIGENKFMHRAFASLNFRGESYMDFSQFVVLMWYHCTISNNLNALLFSVYDQNGDGVLSAAEAEVMVQQMYGKYFSSSVNAQKMTSKVKELGRDGVTKLFFVEFCKRNTEILEPAEKNISLLMKGTLGPEKWHRISEHRKILTKNKFVTICELMATIQEKAGDVDLFNVNEVVEERRAREKKRLNKKYSREYLRRVKSPGKSVETADGDETRSSPDSPLPSSPSHFASKKTCSDVSDASTCASTISSCSSFKKKNKKQTSTSKKRVMPLE